MIGPLGASARVPECQKRLPKRIMMNGTLKGRSKVAA